jgi:hypothetical protein
MEKSMKPQDVSEAKLAWMIWQALEKLNGLLWDRYEKEFLNWAMDENDRKQMEKMLSEEFDDLFEPEF